MMWVLLFAAHQGEEFVLVLPLIMLMGAFFIIRWANQPIANEESEGEVVKEEVVKEEDEIDEAA